MRRTLIPALAAIVLIPTGAFAQEWSAAQKEVWAVETACWQNAANHADCFNPAFVGWGLGSTVPTNFADRKAAWARGRETQDQVYVYLKPMNVRVHGDMAVVLYISTSTSKNKLTGELTTTTERWTDIMLRENGKWSWIADHGTDLTNNN